MQTLSGQVNNKMQINKAESKINQGDLKQESKSKKKAN